MQPDTVVVRQGGRVVLEGRVGADGAVVVQPGDGRAGCWPRRFVARRCHRSRRRWGVLGSGTIVASGTGDSSHIDVTVRGLDGGLLGGTIVASGAGVNVTVAGSGSGATSVAVGNGPSSPRGVGPGTGSGTGDGAGPGSGNGPGRVMGRGQDRDQEMGRGLDRVRVLDRGREMDQGRVTALDRDPEMGQGQGGGSGPGTGYGPGSRPGPGAGRDQDPGTGPGPGPGPDDQPSLAAMLRTPKPNPETPAFVLYISCGNDASEGIVYQTDEHGRILGKVKLPYTATGIALHREHGLVLAIPRDGGKIMEIDDTGKLSTILEKDPALVHPVDVGIPANSDTVVVADNIANVLAFTNTAGVKPKIYRRLSGEKWAAQKMSVAVASDKSVIYGFEGRAGVFRCSGDDATARRRSCRITAAWRPIRPRPAGPQPNRPTRSTATTGMN